MKLTYEAVADRLDLRLCGSCDGPYDHKVGEMREGTMHWSPRRLTRPGLRNFLMRVADDMFDSAGSHIDVPRWRRIWFANTWAYSTARKEFHITIPARYSATDRAYVRWRIQRNREADSSIRAWANPKEATRG